MKELVFLLEERSAQALLESLLPRIINTKDIQCRFITFEGKQDLDRNLEKKLKHYLNQESRFIVLRDKDNHPDCIQLKSNLAAKCHAAGKINKTLIRIACCELETFYLADLAAVEKALKIRGLSQRQDQRKFRNPDKITSPSAELISITSKAYQKIGGSREIGKHIDHKNTRSCSFKHLILAISKFENELMQLP